MKIVKKIAFVLILCLAVVGAYSLLKKASKLHVTDKDRQDLEAIGIVVGDDKPTENGLSAVMSTVQGAPAVGSSMVGSAAPPNFLGGDTAPPYGNAASPSEAPAFMAGGSAPPFAATEAPAFAPSQAPPFNPMDEAPAFAPAIPSGAYASEAPAFPTPAPAVQEAPLYPSNPGPAPAPVLPAPTGDPVSAVPTPYQPPVPVAAPNYPDLGRTMYPPPAPVAAPQYQTPYQPIAGPPQAEIPVTQTFPPFYPVPNESPTALGPPPWEGPTTPMPALPSTTSLEARGVSGVTGPLVNETGWAPSAIGNEVFLADENAFAPAPSAGSDRYIRRLPVVVEAPPAEVVPPAGQVGAEMAALPAVPAEMNPANESPAIYREEPLISFSQQQPISQKIQPTAIRTREVEVLPFTPVAEVSVPVESVAGRSPGGAMFGKPTMNEVAEIEAPPAPAIQQVAAETKPEIRTSVERFVKAQDILAGTGETQRVHGAFVQLNRLYEHRELNETERDFLTGYLDKMALQVIYSKDSHILEKPHVVQPGEGIDQIARHYNVPAALLMKINGLTGSRPLEPGTTLKIIVGPFDAKVSTRRGEMTLILGGLYAGRFTVTLGDQVRALRGEHHVISKTFSYGDRFMTLDNGTTLRETDRSGRGVLPNTIYCSEKDGRELFDILSEHSIIAFED